ncbi:MAG TPA: transketolase, partial [Candidatus Saccharimonadia bacterium]
TIDIDGHNIQSIIDACAMAKTVDDKPTAIIAHTIPGKGVDYMEYDYHWHGNPPGTLDVPGSPPKAEQVKAALDQLRALSERQGEPE